MSKQVQKKDDNGLDFQMNGNRRSFLKFGGATLATTGLLLSGCQEFLDVIPGKQPPKTAPDVQLGEGDLGVLNFAYALEQLEAAFYIKVVATPYGGISAKEKEMMQDLKNHEVAHRDFLKAALGDNAIMDLTFDFSSVNFHQRASVLATAKTFEDLGVAAYNGAGQLLESPDFLLIAGKIVSVEARHAAAIRSIFDSDPKSFAGSDIIDENGLDRAFTPEMVLQAADPFIVNKIMANQLPKS